MRRRKDQPQPVEHSVSYPHEIDGIGIVYPQIVEESERVPEGTDSPQVSADSDADSSETGVD